MMLAVPSPLIEIEGFLFFWGGDPLGSFLIITKRMGILAKPKKFSCGHSNQWNPMRPHYRNVIGLLMTEGTFLILLHLAPCVLHTVKLSSQFSVSLPTECQLQPINTADLEEINSPHWAMCH